MKKMKSNLLEDLLFFIANKVPKNNQVYIFKDILAIQGY